PWETGRPQPALRDLAEAGAFRGRVLDVGCGTGEVALLAAALGLPTVGIDSAPTAIETARRKAREQGLDVRFQVG
ncbi:class I SAM-dependent methyltransferase, partial [Streptomyces stackebrandtii]|uniref:class I SAM-dependent methyltransferase n=1 Tax=Streptomyces stackebrandtii TaxID=3051177 RepID=UPI0028DB262F